MVERKLVREKRGGGGGDLVKAAKKSDESMKAMTSAKNATDVIGHAQPISVDNRPARRKSRSILTPETNLQQALLTKALLHKMHSAPIIQPKSV
jgi:hypothetical protein